MDKQLNLESLDELIKEVKNYDEKLNQSIKVLNNASNICDQAMGSDKISKKYIEKLDEAIKEIENTSALVRKVIEALQKDYNSAKNVLDSVGGN